MRLLRPLLLSTFLGAGVLATQIAPVFAQASGCPPIQGDLGGAAADAGDLYPPSHDMGTCGCRVAGAGTEGGLAAFE